MIGDIIVSAIIVAMLLLWYCFLKESNNYDND